MWTTNFIETVTERDIDLLLLEEFTVNPRFREWFTAVTLQRRFDGPAFLGALHSICDSQLGESDIVIGFTKDAQTRLALMLENKIDAVFQPDQAERYHRRGEVGIKQNNWEEFVTCIVAPEVFLKNQTGVSEFDLSCSYESLVSWFQSDDGGGDRGRYKAQLLQYAVQKTRRSGLANISAEVSVFWNAYHQLAAIEFPKLRLPAPGPKGPNADWPDFRNVELPKGTHILHKWHEGKVDLELTGLAKVEEAIRQKLGPLLPDDFTIEITGKSVVVRHIVPPLHRWQPFEIQKDAARQGFRAIELLAQFGRRVLPDSGVLNLKRKDLEPRSPPIP